MREQPAGQFRLSVGFVPDVVLPARILPEAHVAAGEAQGLIHEHGLPGRYHRVIGAVEDPYGRSADSVGVGLSKSRFAPALRSVRPEDTAANRDNRGKAAGVVFSDLPGTVASE